MSDDQKPDWLNDDPDDEPDTGEADAGAATSGGQTMLETHRTWVMVFLTLIFVILYILGLIGCVKGAEDNTLVEQLQPILFAIIGYYFGRVPSERNEKLLTDNVEEETRKRNEAEGRATTARIRAERAETRIRNARAALTTGAPESTRRDPSTVLGIGGPEVNDRSVRHAAAAALRILE